MEPWQKQKGPDGWSLEVCLWPKRITGRKRCGAHEGRIPEFRRDDREDGGGEGGCGMGGAFGFHSSMVWEKIHCVEKNVSRLDLHNNLRQKGGSRWTSGEYLPAIWIDVPY